MSNYFEGIVGQERAKRKLTLYLDGFKMTSRLPNLLFEGSNGAGKTILAQRVAKHTKRKWLEVNGSAIKNVKSFVNQVLLPMTEEPSLLFLDEIHAIPRSVADMLLSVTNPTAAHKNTVRYDDVDLVFDFHSVAFMFATTERQKIFKPLQSRLTPVSLSDYDTNELSQILKFNAKDINIDDDAAIELATYARGSGRSAALVGREVDNFCKVYSKTTFSKAEVYNLMEILDIYPLGLTEQEVAVLAHVRSSNGGISLTALAAKTNMTKEAQQAMEHYLLKHGLMKIDGVRQITQAGMNYLKEIGR